MSEPRPSIRPPRRDPRLAALAADSGYTVRERIGAGGMGIVYRATDADGQDVALKLLRPEIADDPRARRRLAREVAAQRRLRDENIVRVIDAELDSPEAFVATEFVPGPTLEDAVRSRGGLHPEIVREIGLILGGTLRSIHRAGVVHRDLKPSNILLRDAAPEDLDGYDPDGPRVDPVIIDFGIALAAEESRLTSTGLVMGTAAYLDPEIMRTNVSTPAGDWWAWAAILAFAATGREPFGSGRADIVFLRADRGEIDLAGVPPELAGLLRDALTAAPARRPDPEDLLRRLERIDMDAAVEGAEVSADDEAGAAAAELSQSSLTAEPRTEVIPPVGRLGTATAPLDVADGYRAPVTEVIPVQDVEDRGRTEVLPVAARSERSSTPPEPPTAVLPPVLGAPTQALPRIAEPIAPQPYPPHPAPLQAYSPQGFQPHPAPASAPPGYPAAPAPPPRRPLLVGLGHLLLIGVAGVAPYLSLILMLVLGALARTWEASSAGLLARRSRGERGGGWTVGVAAPFRALLNLLVVALQALLPLVLGLVLVVALDAVLVMSLQTRLPVGVLHMGAMAVCLLLTWFGLGGGPTRRGAHRMVGAAAPDRVWSAVLAGLLLLLLAAVALTFMARNGAPDYFPFPQIPPLTEVLVWRR
ncbi:serine/threonine protein kinase [Brachybacterium sp. EF45031]|uniref:serine/threonine-protein kinase n=1 Tax=Brachybacterium sillae TaxID=2810536 RepID=UPI00217ECB01|nr:serine/threonine-protein kinase [Brachybacterium sillae]MCS6711447.1 serine/threonine protein kinase [Brachybacterium sillae]